MMTDSAVVLDELVNPNLTVELNGKAYAVKPIDGFAYQLLQGVSGKDELKVVEILYRIAARCLAPAMTREEVLGSEETTGLTVEQVSAVVQVARSQVEQVEAITSPNSEPAKATRESKTPSPAPHRAIR